MSVNYRDKNIWRDIMTAQHNKKRKENQSENF